MVRAYPLYFDRARIDWERRGRRGAAIGIIAAHVFLIAWLLSTHPPRPTAMPSMVVVELNAIADATAALDRRRGEHDTRRAPAAPAATRTKSAAREPGTATHAGGAARPASDAGRLGVGREEQAAAASMAGAATATGGAPALGGSAHGGAGTGSGGRFVPPRVVSHIVPRYPRDAWLAHAEGDVDVIVTIGADGELLDAHVDRSSGNAALDAAAVEAVRRYRFRAAMRGSEPVEAQAIVGVEWRITPGLKVDLNVDLPADTRDRDVRQKLQAVDFLRANPDGHLHD